MSGMQGFGPVAAMALALASVLAGRVMAADGAAAAEEPYRDKYPCTQPYPLPELLQSADGKQIDTPAAWQARRGELLEQFRKEVYGRAPGKPEKLSFELTHRDDNAMDGKAILKQVVIHSQQQDRKHEFTLTMFLPKQGTPASVFLLLNNRGPKNTDPTRKEKSGFWPAEEVIARGYGVAAIQVSQLAPDKTEHYREGVIRLFEGDTPSTSPDSWKAISAWAWGASRAMDYLETDPDVNAKRVAVIGHSRGGKTALWTGAQDERFALAISSCSGCTGASLARRPVGETITKINATFPYWFCDNYRKYNDHPERLPIDQHMLLALMAPRPVYVASKSEDWWANPRGEYEALAYASQVYRLYGGPAMDPAAMPPLDTPRHWGMEAYHVRRGEHDLTAWDWQRYMDFADQVWSRAK